jgi:stage V sporulation protein AC
MKLYCLTYAQSVLSEDQIFEGGSKKRSLPITGFSNSITSAAMEFKAEGWILDLGAKIFQIAGPVIAYGTVASVVYGLIYWITTII